MQESISAIIEKSSLPKKEKLQRFLDQSIKISNDSAKRTTATHDNVLFKTDVFFEGLAKCLNDIPTADRLLLGVELLQIVFEELGFDLDKEDAFIVYQLRDLGKFKIRDAKLREQLQILWKQNKDYILTDQEFARTLKILMKVGIIDYRKGNLALKKDVLIRYKD